MPATSFRKLVQAYDVWTPVAFSAILTVITLVTYVASGLSDAWIVPFVAFQPIMFATWPSRSQDRRHIKMLERRLPQLSANEWPLTQPGVLAGCNKPRNTKTLAFLLRCAYDYE